MAVPNDDLTEPMLEVGARFREGKNGHHLGRGSNNKPGFPGNTVHSSTQADDGAAQRAIIHIQSAVPPDVRCIDIQIVALVEVVVEHRGE